MLEIETLSVAAGEFLLREASLTVRRGECHALIGPSGAGKSTLLRAVLGLTAPVAGRIRLEGRDLARVPIEKRELGYLPQQLALFPHLTVRENLTYSARARRAPEAAVQPLLDELVAATDLGALLDRRPDTLSGGERQRVGLVRALVSQPKALLLDEPLAALNESFRRELWGLLRNIQRRWHPTILLVTHDLAEAYFLADRITVLIEGRVAQQGEKAEVFSRPASADVARFIGVENLHPGRVLAVRDGLADVQVGAARLTALAPDPPTDEALVSIRGDEVMLMSGAPPRASARNALPARVLAVQPGSPLWRVEMDAGFPLTAMVTRSACEELGLCAGSVVTAYIKAPAVHLLGPAPAGGGRSARELDRPQPLRG